MSIDIRKVLIREAREYAVLHIKCWQDAYKGIISDNYLDNMTMELEQRVERCRQVLNDPGDCLYFYAECDGDMIGRLAFGICRDDDKINAGEVYAIYLLEAFWNNSYGKQMMDFAVEKLKRAGYREVIVWVLEDNQRARRFYEKYGFVHDGCYKNIEIGEILVETRYVLDL